MGGSSQSRGRSALGRPRDLITNERRWPFAGAFERGTDRQVKIRNRGPLEEAAGRAVRDYLQALRSPGRRRGRVSSTREQALRRIAEIEDELADATTIRELRLVQERQDLRRVIDHDEQRGREALETRFVAAAGAYGRRHGITYRTWREIGVPAAVLRRAGIKP